MQELERVELAEVDERREALVDEHRLHERRADLVVPAPVGPRCHPIFRVPRRQLQILKVHGRDHRQHDRVGELSKPHLRGQPALLLHHRVRFLKASHFLKRSLEGLVDYRDQD